LNLFDYFRMSLYEQLSEAQESLKKHTDKYNKDPNDSNKRRVDEAQDAI